MQPLLNTLDTPLDAGVARDDGTCGDRAEDTTVMVLLYHKMGTVWWQHATRTSDYAHWSSVFTVDAGADDALLVRGPALPACHSTGDVRGTLLLARKKCFKKEN